MSSAVAPSRFSGGRHVPSGKVGKSAGEFGYARQYCTPLIHTDSTKCDRSEARFLDAIFERIFTRFEEQERSPDRTQRDLFRVGLGPEMNQLYRDGVGLTEGDEIPPEAPVALDNFRRLQLIEGPSLGRPQIELTAMGFAFASAISRPQKQQS